MHAKKHGIQIRGVSLYHAPSYFDRGGNRRGQEPFMKFDAMTFAEEGWTDKLTFGLNISSQVLHQEQDNLVWVTQKGEQPYPKTLSVTDPDMHLRYGLWSEQEKGYALSLQSSVKIPSFYFGGGISGVNTNQASLEMAVLGGKGFRWKGYDHFVNLEFGYREYFDGQDYSLRHDATWGTKLSHKWMVLGQSFTTHNARGFVRIIGQDSSYDLTKLQLSAVREINDQNAIQFGVFGDVKGKNTGSGIGIILNIWKKF
ncbi:MAG: hypothetical protein K0R63_1344 [Rickettsiales bacterium]|nr:hypothetical protein [Rickettsiales bacterium]